VSTIPPEIRERLENLRWRPESIETWWSTPRVSFRGLRPAEMAPAELEELVAKIEEGHEMSRRVARPLKGFRHS
jgi:hypothetical protein